VSEREIKNKYIDLHCHGGAGFYFSDPNPENIQTAIDFHKSHGSAQLLVSLVSATISDLELQILRLLPFFQSGEIAGIHLEGPYLAHNRCGAHDPKLLKSPNIEELKELIDYGQGAIKMITIAPELDGALASISYLSSNKIIAAIGHSDGNYDDALRAVEAGAGLVTHFSNGMSKLRDGERTFATALLNETDLPLELIIDKHHVNEEDFTTIVNSASKRIVFVTDAMAAAGQPDGDYTIGNLDVVVKEKIARLRSNGALAGSTLTTAQAVSNARDWNLPDDVIEHAAIHLPQELLNRTR
jgi:N-acetylglucosamine-6-phosphate deacetylase